jgi:hypothetical protein
VSLITITRMPQIWWIGTAIALQRYRWKVLSYELPELSSRSAMFTRSWQLFVGSNASHRNAVGAALLRCRRWQCMRSSLLSKRNYFMGR